MKPVSTLWRCKLELSKWAELKTLPIKGGMKQKWLSSFFPYCDISLWNCFRDVIFPYLYWISAFPDRKSITHMNPRESEKKLCGWGWWSDYICFVCRIRLLLTVLVAPSVGHPYAGHILEDFIPDLHPPILASNSRLFATDILSKNPQICSVITIILLL